MITSTVEHRKAVFADWRIGRLLVHEFKRAQEQGLAESMAWVVMPDHFHWLLELQQGSLAALVKQVKASSSVAINRALHQSGRLWQPGFHDVAVRRDEDLQHLARYIVANPLRAGLVKRLGNYPLWDAVWV
jgi:REP element-mobilizing transposase RayT